MPLVKICGVTSSHDAALCARYGADFIGLIFAQSKRRITKSGALKITERLKHLSDSSAGRRTPKLIGVFQDDDMEVVLDHINSLGLWGVQLHGAESPDTCKRYSERCSVIKTIHAQSLPKVMDLIMKHIEASPIILLDTYTKERSGGTGRTFNWDIAAKVSSNLPGVRMMVAGGLRSDNVAAAIAEANPWAVDVSSGVEASTGVKSEELIKRFIDNSKEH